MTKLGPGAESLVRAARSALKPAEADRQRVFLALRERLGDAALLADGGSLSASAGAGRSIWTTVSAVAVGVGVVGGALFFALRAEDEPVAPKPVPVVVAPKQPVAPGTAAVVEPAPVAVPAPAPVEQPSARRPSDKLAEEVAILSRAAKELQAGRAAEALRVLDEHQRKFPGGSLAEERRAARVQALCALGRRSEAEAELARLVRASPQSPQVARARQFCAARP